MVDVGVAITGIEGSFPYGQGSRWTGLTAYACAEYRQTKRVSALTLHDNPHEITKDFLMPLLNAMSQGRLDSDLLKSLSRPPQ